MKNIFKNPIFMLALGLIIAGSIGVYATIKIQADEIGYKDGTVEEALNDLYGKTQKSCSQDEIDDYDNKTYTQEGLTVYDNRVTILNGGYYVDTNNVTWVNITLKTIKSLSNEGAWLLICGFPNINENFYVTDYNKKHAFRVGQNDGKNYSNCITYRGDALITDISTGKEFILKFKY